MCCSESVDTGMSTAPAPIAHRVLFSSTHAALIVPLGDPLQHAVPPKHPAAFCGEYEGRCEEHLHSAAAAGPNGPRPAPGGSAPAEPRRQPPLPARQCGIPPGPRLPGLCAASPPRERLG